MARQIYQNVLRDKFALRYNELKRKAALAAHPLRISDGDRTLPFLKPWVRNSLPIGMTLGCFVLVLSKFDLDKIAFSFHRIDRQSAALAVMLIVAAVSALRVFGMPVDLISTSD